MKLESVKPHENKKPTPSVKYGAYFANVRQGETTLYRGSFISTIRIYEFA